MKTERKTPFLALGTSLTAAAITLTLLLTGGSAEASVAGMAGTWEGTGTVYSLDGEVQGDYALQMVDTLQSDGSVASAITVASPGSPDKQLEYLFKDTTHGFTMSSSQGSGGATCLAGGLCEGYFGDANGNGVAITLILDGPNRFRSVKTQLQGFKAVRLYEESYVRAQQD